MRSVTTPKKDLVFSYIVRQSGEEYSLMTEQANGDCRVVATFAFDTSAKDAQELLADLKHLVELGHLGIGKLALVETLLWSYGRTEIMATEIVKMITRRDENA